jgi:hypothetical protein
MATLILTTVGGAIGGPVGAALGGLLGNAIDRSVLKPKGRQGPRLDELKVQTSSYGTPIPQVFGTMRVAGTVVWATDLKETRSKSGKGRPSTTSYSYSASFAVLLSARGVQGVGRIWADGKLLRGAAGDWKAQTGFRLHLGEEEQGVDPLIASAEGAALTPAMRGQAYAVFEDLQLADFGNRIPSLTFELVADPEPVAIAGVAAAFGVTAEAPGRSLDGFSAYGDSRRGVLETLATIDGAWFAASEDGIVLRHGPGSTTSVVDAGVSADGRGIARSRQFAGAGAAPVRLAVAHYDPARDYQAGLQRVLFPGGAGTGGREERVELPAALSAAAAKAVAEGMLARAQARREQRTVALGSAGLGMRPGDRVTVAGEAGLWRVARWTLERMVVRLELERIARAPMTVPASAGRVSGAPDLVHGPTVLHAFEIPPVDDTVLDTPRLAIAAAGGPGWRQAALLLSTDDGARWSGAGAALVPATLGTVTVPPGEGGSLLVDRDGFAEVELLHAGMSLSDADMAALDAGANLALVGDELLQFGSATPLGDNRWRLGTLWRGRRGTEWACAGHAAGERFVLIEPEALVSASLPLAALGGTVRVLASGVGDPAGPAEAMANLDGASVRPPAPVRLRWDETEDGGAIVRWTRRSRGGWRWADGSDAPLGEEAERYRVTIGAREADVSEPAVAVTAAERAAGAAVTVRQQGTLAESAAATLVLPTS